MRGRVLVGLAGTYERERRSRARAPRWLSCSPMEPPSPSSVARATSQQQVPRRPGASGRRGEGRRRRACRAAAARARCARAGLSRSSSSSLYAVGSRVEDDEIGDQTLVSPVLVGEKRLPDEWARARARSMRTSRIGWSPEMPSDHSAEAGRPFSTGVFTLSGEYGIGQQQARGQTLEHDRFLGRMPRSRSSIWLDVHAQVDRALCAADVVVLLGQVVRRFVASRPPPVVYTSARCLARPDA